MEWNQIEGNWEQAKGKVREWWGKLTDDDLTVVKGRKDQLLGKLQERYGYRKEQAEDEVSRFIEQFDTKSSSAGSCGCGSVDNSQARH